MYLGKIARRLLEYVSSVDKSICGNALLKNILFDGSKLSDYPTYESVSLTLKSISKRIDEKMFFCSRENRTKLSMQLNALISVYDYLKECNIEEQFEIYRKYILNAFGLYESIFCLDGELVESRLIQEEIVPDLLNLGVNFLDGKGSVSIFNPIVGQVLLFADKKFALMCEDGEFLNSTTLDKFVYLLKTQRLLTELMFCNYKMQSVFKISEMINGEKDSLPLQKLDYNGRMEEIDISRTAEKIYYAVIDIFEKGLKEKERENYILNCLISDYDSFGQDAKKEILYSVLKKEFEDFNLSNKFDVIINPVLKTLSEGANTERKLLEISASADKFVVDYEIIIDYVNAERLIDKLDDDKYNLVFVLDSMYLYRPFNTSACQDEINFIGTLKRNRGNSGGLFDKTSFKFYKNWTNYKSLYDRLSAMLIKPVTFNPKLNINVNEQVITYFKNQLNTNSENFKIMYFYISDNEAFFRNKYEDYRFVRSERYNGKDVKIVRLASNKINRQLDKNGVIKNEKSDKVFVDITAYQFIKMYFSEEDVIKDIFGIPFQEKNCLENLIDTVIRIKIGKDLVYNLHNIDIDFILTNNYSYSDSVIKNLSEIFFRLDKPSQNGECDMLNACIRKGLFYSIIGRADKFEQILMAYFIKEKIGELKINVSDKSRNGREDLFVERKEYIKSVPHGVDNYTYVHNVLDIISTFDRIYSNTKAYDLEFVYWKNSRTSKLKEELRGLMSACENLRYTDSRLFYNLKSYYEG